MPKELPSNCPQNTSRDSKKSYRNSKSTRDFKSLLSFELSCKISLLSILQREGKSNPALSIISESQTVRYRTSVDCSITSQGAATFFVDVRAGPPLF